MVVVVGLTVPQIEVGEKSDEKRSWMQLDVLYKDAPWQQGSILHFVQGGEKTHFWLLSRTRGKTKVALPAEENFIMTFMPMVLRAK